ncbi:MAG: cyclic nucleotide-binding domain-containing protein [Elusimicrobia bacterium]|nr:cyclic nucleotide-binding domain-containing protein [Candidatus Liberimonas magnetica]
MNKIFKKGELIIKEGTSGNEAFIIQSGRVEVYRNVEGVKIILAVLAKNQIFGEMSMIDDRPRSATVEALEDTTVTVINRNDFNRLFYTKPEALTWFLKKIFERLRNIDQNIIETTVGKTAESYSEGKIILSGVTQESKEALNYKTIEIKKFPFKIGRQTESFTKDLFSHNDLYLKDRVPFNVSRNHLSLQFFKGKFFIIDRGSTLGTIVNDVRIGGPVRNHEIELSSGKDYTIIVGSAESQFKFKVSVS